MFSVIFSTALLGLGKMVGAAVNAVGLLPRSRRFEVSEDGEYLYSYGERYDFIGFGEDGHYISDTGEEIVPGRTLGVVINDDGCKVREMRSFGNTYVMVTGATDCAEIYRLREI